MLFNDVVSIPYSAEHYIVYSLLKGLIHLHSTVASPDIPENMMLRAGTTAYRTDGGITQEHGNCA